MEKLIIQQNKRQGRLSEFIKSSGDSLTLGRGFENDITLSDHFIAEEQICFNYIDGHWVLKLLDMTNPVLINDKRISRDGVTVENGDQLLIGRTHLVLLLSNHPIEHTRKLMLSNWMYHKILRYVLPLLMLLISACIAVFSEYQELTGKIHWGQLTAGGLSYALFIILWAGSWALVGRLLRHKPHFFVQLFYTSLTMTGFTVGALFSGYVEYITTASLFAAVIEWGFLLFILGMLLKYNLTYATELKKRGWISFSVIAAFMLFSVATTYLEKRDFSSRADYSKTLKPPLVKWLSDTSIDDYMNDVEAQFDELKVTE